MKYGKTEERRPFKDKATSEMLDFVAKDIDYKFEKERAKQSDVT